MKKFLMWALILVTFVGVCYLVLKDMWGNYTPSRASAPVPRSTRVGR